MKRNLLSILALLCLTVTSAWAAAGDTYVVDGNGGGDYTSISAAVSAATGGEKIFIKNGEYEETQTITIVCDLTIEGESQDGVRITGPSRNSLFKATTDKIITLTLSKVTIYESGGGNFPAIQFTYCDHEITIKDCTFDNCGSRYGAIQFGHPGKGTIDGCTFINSKCTANLGAGVIYISSAGTFTIKNTLIEGVQYTPGSGYMYGAIYVNNSSATLNIENTTITNVTSVPARGVIFNKGTVNIKNSTIQGNTLSKYNQSNNIICNDGGTVTIEQTIISDNTCADEIFCNNGSTPTLTVNYCNIQNNTAYGIVNDNGTIDLEANYWGSNNLPDDVTAATWVVENNGEYTLNTGEALAKEIPGLVDEPQPVTYVYVSPDGGGDGSSYDNPTSLKYALMMGLAPEGGSIFLRNGEYEVRDLWFIYSSINFVGESRDGVILYVTQGFAIANYEDPFDENFSVESVSFSRMTFETDGAPFVICGSCNVNELNITDCMINADNFVSCGISIEGDLMPTTGTLNFKKNIVQGTISVITVTGNWNANINDNIFIDENSGANLINFLSDGECNVDYNYWGSNDPATPLYLDDFIIATASANATEIFTDESAAITVAMTLSDGTTNAKDHLPDYTIEATLTAAGDLSANSVTLQEGAAQVTYSSDVARNDNVRISILGQTLTVPITVKERYLGPIYVATTGSDDNGGSENAPVATVGKAVELALINGGSGQVIINEGTYTGNGYRVTGDLTVTGVGDVTLDANNEGRLFYMSYGDAASKIELSNLVLTKANGYGAAVYSFANELILDNVTIDNTQANGYLIYSKGKLTVKDSNISNSKSGDVIQQNGNGDILIQNSVFKDNVATGNTEYAVINLNSYSGNLVVENSKFINNIARQGVIKGNYNYNIDVKGTEFVDNTNAAAYGGAIYTIGGTLDITDCIFVNNKAARSGGAIYVGYRSTATVYKSIFVNNVANTMDDDYYGDAIYNGNKLTVNNSVLLTNANNDLIYNDGEDNVVNAQNNWWGTNDDPSSLNGAGTYEDDDWEEHDCPPVDVSNWATMDASFAPAEAQAGDEVTITAVFSNAILPDGINVTFTSTSGLNTVVPTVNAQASTTYTIDANDEAIVATSTNAVVEMPILTHGQLPGDADCDEQVTISDAIAVVNYILGNVPAIFNMENADVDGSNSITITDAVNIVKMVLNQVGN